MQLIWDLVDPMSWVDVVAANPRKLTQVVWAKNDAQVTHLGAYNLARGLGARTFSNIVTGRANETLYGIPTLEGTSTNSGHVIIGYEFNQPVETPITNTAPTGYDTHNDVYKTQTFVTRSAILAFERRHDQVCEGKCTYD